MTEEGDLYPSFDFVLAILKAAEIDLEVFTENLDEFSKGRFLSRVLNVDEKKKNGEKSLEFIFQYGDYKASYSLENANIEQYELLLKTMRDRLNDPEVNKRDSIVATFF